METIGPIAEAHGLDKQKAITAAWLHDCAKEEPKSSFRKLVRNGEIEIDDETYGCPKLWHGFHAAYWGRTRFQIDDENILQAVRYHPTGAPGMSGYGQALFVSDYCEPGRGLEGTSEIARLAEHDLIAAALEVVNRKIDYIRQKGKKPHSRSIAYRDWLLAERSN